MPSNLDAIAQRVEKATPPAYLNRYAKSYPNEDVFALLKDLAYLLSRVRAAEAVCELVAYKTKEHRLCDVDCRVDDGPCPHFDTLKLLATWEAAR